MFEKIKELIVNYVDVDPASITEESRFIEDLGFNSYMFMSMLGEVEDEFDITVDEQEVIKLRTVADAMAYFEKLQG
ncbi:MAG: acyl carrier protein [Oscillospiraceae bacterium]